MKKILSYILIIYILFLTGCGKKPEKKTVQSNVSPKLEVKKDIDLNILTTDKLIYSMVKGIVKDKHNVEYIFKNRDSEINFQFSEDALNNIARKDIFIYMGCGFEPWINNFLDKLSKNKVGVINASRGAKLMSYNRVVKYKDMVLKDNPYYLMNLDNYKIALMNVKNSVQDRDPKNRDIYEKNFSDTLNNVDKYEKELKDLSSKLGEYRFISNEEELAYFIKFNDFKNLDINKDFNNSKENLEAKIKEEKKLIFIYNDANILKEYEDIIKKYNINVLNIKVYNGEQNYEDIIRYNIEILKKFYETQISNR